MQGTRGMIGGQVVFRVRKGKQVVGAPPTIDEEREPTANQKVSRSWFKKATDYANNAIKDEVMKAAYQKVASKRQSAQNMAFRDAFYPPQVHRIITQGYKGEVGDIVVVHATDDFRVQSVYISIYDSAGKIIEQGDATSDKHGVVWLYVATKSNANVNGCTIEATATDLPSNKTNLEVTI